MEKIIESIVLSLLIVTILSGFIILPWNKPAQKKSSLPPTKIIAQIDDSFSLEFRPARDRK